MAGRHLVARGRQRRLDKSGEGRFHADRRRLTPLKRHAEKLRATKDDSNWHSSIRSGPEKLEPCTSYALPLAMDKGKDNQAAGESRIGRALPAAGRGPLRGEKTRKVRGGEEGRQGGFNRM
jgi:hypothetical protein